MNRENQLQKFQHSFCLSPCADTGSLVWKLDWELTMGVIVGNGPDGTTYVINNQPTARNYTLQSIDTYHNKYCFYDLNNPNLDRKAMTLLAFQLLHQYNQFNGQSYLKDHKIILPLIQVIEPEIETQLIRPNLLLPQKINQIAAPIFTTKQLITNRLVGLFQRLFTPQNNGQSPEMPSAFIREFKPNFLKSSNERTA